MNTRLAEMNISVCAAARGWDTDRTVNREEPAEDAAQGDSDGNGESRPRRTGHTVWQKFLEAVREARGGHRLTRMEPISHG